MRQTAPSPAAATELASSGNELAQVIRRDEQASTDRDDRQISRRYDPRQHGLRNTEQFTRYGERKESLYGAV